MTPGWRFETKIVFNVGFFPMCINHLLLQNSLSKCNSLKQQQCTVSRGSVGWSVSHRLSYATIKAQHANLNRQGRIRARLLPSTSEARTQSELPSAEAELSRAGVPRDRPPVFADGPTSPVFMIEMVS